MMPIFICEDDPIQRNKIEKIIESYLFIEGLLMRIQISTDNPLEILKHVEGNPKEPGIFFLDVNLNFEMDGIVLGSKIRELNRLASIVFITTHSELSYLTFIHKVEAMDYIIKNQTDMFQTRITSCLEHVYKKSISDVSRNESLKIRMEDQVILVKHQDVMFVRSSQVPHKLVLHAKNSQIEFYGKLKDLESQLPQFHRCHKSYLVNLENIKVVHPNIKEAEMINGETCLISARLMPDLLSHLKKLG